PTVTWHSVPRGGDTSMTRDAMTAPPRQQLHQTYAAAVPELSVPWQADPPARPELAWLNEQLARELGYEPQWLRSPAGLALLTGQLDATGAPLAERSAGPPARLPAAAAPPPGRPAPPHRSARSHPPAPRPRGRAPRR